MNRSGIFLAPLSLLLFSGTPARGVDESPLAKWVETLDTENTQRKILNLIFRDQVGAASEAISNKQTGLYLFPKGGTWVRLEKNAIFVSANDPGGPYLVVTCALHNRPDRESVSAVSYVFYDIDDKPTAISGGYSGSQDISDVKLPKLKKRFVLMVDVFGMPKRTQTSASLVELRKGEALRTAWMSPNSAHNFQFGFDTLGGNVEELVFRATSKQGEKIYSAYRWTGSRFEQDGFASQIKLKALPDDVWKYGSPLQ